MGRKSIIYKETGESRRGTRRGYHGSPIPRDFSIVTKDDIKDINKKYYHNTGKYHKTNFTIGFELEKVNLPPYREYALFKGYESDSSLSGRGSGEAITNILPLVPKGRLRNKIFELMFIAERVIDSDTNRSCGGHTTICVSGMSSEELRDKIRNYSGLIYALYRRRLQNSFCRQDIRMRETSQNRYSTALIKSGGCVEYRLPSAVLSTHSLVRRYEIFFELLDFAVNRNRVNFSQFVRKCRPILLRMYGYNTEQVDMITRLAKDFQSFINTGRVSGNISEYIR